jgi:glutamate 5-kinase
MRYLKKFTVKNTYCKDKNLYFSEKFYDMKKLRLIFSVEEETLVNTQSYIDKDLLNSIAMILTNLRNSNKEILLVTAGAIASGIEQLKLPVPPKSLSEKQAIAAIGQVELIKRYQNLFDEYTQMVAQVLVARDIINNPKQQKNARNTFRKLVSLGIIPIINENDTISTADIEEENNYFLTATVANIVEAHAIISINKNLSFNILLRGKAQSTHCANKDELFAFCEKLKVEDLQKRSFKYPDRLSVK